MSVTIAGIRFDQHDYDERGDVLYLSVEGYEGPPATATRALRATTSDTTRPDG
jgi:hypothetical protein